MILREGQISIAAFIAGTNLCWGESLCTEKLLLANEKVLKKYDVLFLDDEIVLWFRPAPANWFGKETVLPGPT